MLETRITSQVQIGGMQFGFILGKGTGDAIFYVGQMMEKHPAKENNLAFVDPKKVFDRVLRGVMRWQCSA